MITLLYLKTKTKLYSNENYTDKNFFVTKNHLILLEKVLVVTKESFYLTF